MPTHTSALLLNQALTIAAAGNERAAIPLYRRALSIKEEILGPEHPDVAMTLHNLAALCKATGHQADARSLCERALEIFVRTLGEAHPRTKICRDSCSQLSGTPT